MDGDRIVRFYDDFSDRRNGKHSHTNNRAYHGGRVRCGVHYRRGTDRFCTSHIETSVDTSVEIMEDDERGYKMTTKEE